MKDRDTNRQRIDVPNLKTVIKQIEIGTFPTRDVLIRCQSLNIDTFNILKEAYFRYLIFHHLNPEQSVKAKTFISVFRDVINFNQDREFIYIVILRTHLDTLPELVRILSIKILPEKRSSFYSKIISLLLSQPNSDKKIIESQIKYSLSKMGERLEQNAFMDFLAKILKPSDFLLAMIFCDEMITDKNYKELLMWSALRNSDFLRKSSLEELKLILPLLRFKSISTLSIVDDLYKHLRAFQFELKNTHDTIKNVEESLYQHRNILYNNGSLEIPDDNDDQMDFYKNYRYGIK